VSAHERIIGVGQRCIKVVLTTSFSDHWKSVFLGSEKEGWSKESNRISVQNGGAVNQGRRGRGGTKGYQTCAFSGTDKIDINRLCFRIISRVPGKGRNWLMMGGANSLSSCAGLVFKELNKVIKGGSEKGFWWRFGLQAGTKTSDSVCVEGRDE